MNKATEVSTGIFFYFCIGNAGNYYCAAYFLLRELVMLYIAKKETGSTKV